MSFFKSLQLKETATMSVLVCRSISDASVSYLAILATPPWFHRSLHATNRSISVKASLSAMEGVSHISLASTMSVSEYSSRALKLALSLFDSRLRKLKTRLRGYKTFFMLNSIEHEIFPVHKC